MLLSRHFSNFFLLLPMHEVSSGSPRFHEPMRTSLPEIQWPRDDAEAKLCSMNSRLRGWISLLNIVCHQCSQCSWSLCTFT